MRHKHFAGIVGGFLIAASTWVNAEVIVKEAWVRGTVPAQKSTGAFLTITSSEDAKLVGASTPIAKTTEIHHSGTHNHVMHMHAVDAVELPAGKTVELKPGGHHLMLMGLDGAVQAGVKVPFTLTFEDRHGKRTRLEVKADVRPLGQ